MSPLVRGVKHGTILGIVVPPLVALVWTYLSDHPLEWLRIKPVVFD